MCRPRTRPPAAATLKAASAWGTVGGSGARRTREPGHLRDEDDGAEIEPAMGEELHRVRHLGNGKHRAAIESRAHVVAVPFHLPGE